VRRPTVPAVLDRLVGRYAAAADPQRAVPMRAYMRDQFPFLGIPSPRRRELSREALAGFARPTEAELCAIALACWELPEREYQLFACDYLRRYGAVCTPAALDTARTLITTKSWWDTVDALAGRLVGPIVARHPAALSTMDEWVAGDERWLVRAAILHQLTYGPRTDEVRLFHYCRTQAGHPDFFIRKAIGWALRQYAKTEPDAVRRFVRAHGAHLSALSVREALKNLG
jgi:3-methyladenine DNA glycosylase AlkD